MRATTLWSGVILLTIAFALMSCSGLSGSESQSATPTSPQDRATTTERIEAIATRSPAPAPTATPLPTATPTPAPTPTFTPPPVPTPTPAPATADVASCCGTFAWVDASRLVAFDTPANGQPGSWLASSAGGSRTFLSSRFGLPGAGHLMAVPDQQAGVTEIIELAGGGTVATIANGGALTWISPDGSRVAWLERLPAPTPSSSLNRQSRLWVAALDGTNARPVLDLQAAELTWLPDNRRLIVAARTLDGGSPGIWVVDVDKGTYRVLVGETFIQAVDVSPDGTRVAYLVTFSGDPARDGIGIADIDGDGRFRLEATGGFRWAGHGGRLWVLELAADGMATDRLALFDLAAGRLPVSVELGGLVLQDRWEVSPDGRFVAFWRAEDRHVVALGPLLTP